jgi:hypothetical protein
MEVQQGEFMSKPKPKTKAQLDRATDLRLRKTYNISLADYEYLLKIGGDACWISGRPAGDRRLHVDHDHAWKKVPIKTVKCECGDWHSLGVYNGKEYRSISLKKSLAIRKVKRQLLRASVRGLLSYSINAGLQKFSDNPDCLRRAAEYLEEFEKGSPLTGQEEP